MDSSFLIDKATNDKNVWNTPTSGNIFHGDIVQYAFHGLAQFARFGDGFVKYAIERYDAAILRDFMNSFAVEPTIIVNLPQIIYVADVTMFICKESLHIIGAQLISIANKNISTHRIPP